MSGITRARHESIRATATDLVDQVGGVTWLDEITFRRAALIGLAHALAQAESVTYETARRHIARACHRARHPDYTPPPWGGDHRPDTEQGENER